MANYIAERAVNTQHCVPVACIAKCLTGHPGAKGLTKARKGIKMLAPS